MANKQGQVKIGIGFNVDRSSLNDLRSVFNEIRNLKISNGSFSGSRQELQSLVALANQLEKELEEAFNPTLGTVNLTKYNQTLTQTHGSIAQLKQKFLESGQQGEIAYQKFANALLKTNTHLKQSSKLLDKMGETLSNTVRWTVASSALNALTGSIQKSYQFAVDLDTSLNDIRIVTGKSADEMERFAQKANKAAKELGASTKSYANASLIYYQQGLGDEDVAARTSTTIKAANVTGQSAQSVSEQLTAVWNGYKVSAAESELYIDKLAAVAATTAADLEELSVGMSRVASAANVMGVDIDQLNAQLATIVSVTREAPESVGTALKTVFARMSDLEAGTDAETTLGEYTQQMAKFGIQALDANGKLRDMGDVVEEIGGKWNSLNRNQQVALAQTIAGTRQYSRMMALFDNWSMYEESLKTSMNAAGKLQQQQDTYMESTEAHLQKLSTQAEELYGHLFDAESINDVADALTKIVGGIDTFVQSLGGGVGVLRVLTPLLLSAFGPKLSRGIATAALNIQSMVLANKNLAATRALTIEFGSVDGEFEKELVKFKQQQLDLERVLSQEEFDSLSQQIAQYHELKTQVKDYAQQRERAITQIEEFTKPLNLSTDATIDERGLYLANVSQQYVESDTAAVKATTISKLQQGDKDTLAKLDIAALLADAQKLKECFAETSTEAGNLQTAIQQLNSTAETDVEGRAKAAGALIETYQKTGASLKHMGEKAAKASDEVDRLSNDMTDSDAKAKKLGTQLESTFKSLDLSKTIAQVTAFASKVAYLTMGITTLMNLGDIWDNDDLTTGEKFAQTLMNIATTLPMLIQGFTILNPLFAAHKAHKAAIITLQTAENTQKTLNLALQRGYIRSVEKESAMNALNALTEQQVSKETKETIATKIRKGKVLSKSERALLAEGQANLVNAASENLQQNQGILKTGLEKGKNILGGFKKGGQGLVKGFKGARAAKVAGSGVKAAASAGSTAAGTGVAGALGKVGAALGAMGPVGWIAAAAIAAVTVATVLVIRKRNEEKRALEEARKEQQRMIEGLTKASQAFTQAKQALDGYKNLKSSFDGLTKGTSEWNDAMQQAEQTVMDLVTKYPELNDYMSRNADGVLEISEAGLAMVKAQEQLKVNRAQEAKLAADADVRQKQIAYDSEMLLRSVGFKGWAGASDKAKEDLQVILQNADITQYLKDGSLVDQEGKALSLNKEEKFLEGLKGNIDALNKLKESIDENNRLLTIEQSKIISDKLVAQGLSAQEATRLSGMMAAAQTEGTYTLDGKTRDNWIKDRAAEYRKKEGDNKELIKEWARQKGIDYQKIKNVGGSQFKYVDANGNKQTITYDQLSQDMATFEFNNKSTSSTEIKKFREQYAKLNGALAEGGVNSAASNVLNTVLSSNTAMQIKDLTNFSQESIDKLKALAKDTTNELSDVARKALEETVANMEEALKNPGKGRGWSEAANAFVASFENDLGRKLDYETKQNLGDAMMKFSLANGGVGEAALTNFLNALGVEQGAAFVNTIDWAAEDASQKIIEAYEATGKAWDMSNEECYNLISTLERMNGEMFKSRENFAELSKIVSSLGSQGDTISAEEFDQLRASYGKAIDKYFTHMADGTYALIATAKEFADLTEEIHKDQLATELENIEKSFTEFNKTANIIKNKEVEKVKNDDVAMYEGEKARIKAEGYDGKSVEYWKSGAATSDDYEQMFLDYLNTSSGAGLKAAIVEEWGSNYAGSISDILESMGGTELKVDMKSGFNFGGRATYSYEDMYNAIINDRVNAVNQSAFQQTSYSEQGMKNWIAELQKYGFLDETSADAFIARATGSNLNIEADGSNTLMNEIKQSIASATAAFDTDELKDVVNQALIAGMSWEEIAELIPSVSSQIDEATKESLIESANAAILMRERQQAIEKLQEQAEAMDKVNAEYEQMNTLLDAQANLIQLINGENDYESIGANLQRQIDIAQSQMALSKTEMDRLKVQMDVETDPKVWEELNEQWKAASAEYYQNMSTYIEKLKDKEINAINKVFDERARLSRTSAGGTQYSLGMDYVTEEWDLVKQRQDKYLDPVNRAYQTDSLRRKFQSAINDTTDLNMQKKIREVMDDELRILENQGELSEYDLKRAEKKLEILEKEIALRDAQNNKTKMQLMRGADGSYSYQYVADADAMIKAEEDLLAAQNELYNIDLEEYKSTLDEALSLYEKFKEQWVEASKIANEEERKARQDMLKEQYLGEGGLITALLGDDGFNQVKGYLAETGGTAILDSFGSADELVQKMSKSDYWSGLVTELEGVSSTYETIAANVQTWLNSLTEALGVTEGIADAMNAAANSSAMLANWDAEAITTSVISGIQQGIEGMTLQYNKGTDGNPGSFTWVASGDTGLYTGAWGKEGKFLMAHEKELLLNKTDTENILNAVSFVRSLNSSLLTTLANIGGGASTKAAIPTSNADQTIEQKVEITATFPNVNVKGEIEEAFDELINLATQHAFKKKN